VANVSKCFEALLSKLFLELNSKYLNFIDLKTRMAILIYIPFTFFNYYITELPKQPFYFLQYPGLDLKKSGKKHFKVSII